MVNRAQESKEQGYEISDVTVRDAEEALYEAVEQLHRRQSGELPQSA